jgi:hypothetical protein
LGDAHPPAPLAWLLLTGLLLLLLLLRVCTAAGSMFTCDTGGNLNKVTHFYYYKVRRMLSITVTFIDLIECDRICDHMSTDVQNARVAAAKVAGVLWPQLE